MYQKTRNIIEKKCEYILEGLLEGLLEICSWNVKVPVEQIVFQIGGSITYIEGDQVEFESKISKNIKYIVGDQVEFESKISKNGCSFKIELKEGLIKQRQRFNISHELGHLFLHMGFTTCSEDTIKWGKLNNSDSSNDYFYKDCEIDHEADCFAMAILMPKKIYKRVIDENMNWSDNTVNISGVAESFGVSKKQAIVRGQNLGFF